MTKKYRSEALAAAHEAALGLAEAGLMSKRTKRKFDEMCLEPVRDMTSADQGHRGRPGSERPRPHRGDAGPVQGGCRRVAGRGSG